jgi:hypothetical protein
MGTYIYGVSSKNRKVKGLDEPVFELRYVSKPSYGWEVDTFTARMCGVYNRKPSMKGKLVSYELYNEDMPVFPIFRYKIVDNTYYDSADDRVLEPAGYVKRVGKKGLAVATKEEYEDAMILLRAKEMRLEGDYNPWDNALVLPANGGVKAGEINVMVAGDGTGKSML